MDNSEMMKFEAKIRIAKDIRDMQADLQVSIDPMKKLLRLKDSDLLEIKAQLDKGHSVEFF